MAKFIKLKDDVILNIASIRSIECGFIKTIEQRQEIQLPIIRVTFFDNTSTDYRFDTIEKCYECMEKFTNVTN